MAFEYVPLIEKYGYVATFVGTILEGESLLILSGLCAHRGYLSFPGVVIVGALGGTLGDMIFFMIGRHYGPRFLQRFPRFAPAASRVHAMIERHSTLTILAVRFMYGLRTAGPTIIGTTRIPFAEFALLNAVGALVWSACWAGAGYLVGKTAEHFLGNLARIEREVFGAVILGIVLVVIAYHVWRARKSVNRP
jgi:membrane protein DedA with SNARE-associated domain